MRRTWERWPGFTSGLILAGLAWGIALAFNGLRQWFGTGWALLLLPGLIGLAAGLWLDVLARHRRRRREAMDQADREALDLAGMVPSSVVVLRPERHRQHRRAR